MYFDLGHRIRTDADFRIKLNWYGREIEKARSALDHNAAATGRLRQLTHDFLRICNYNPALLAGYYFPHYPKDKPFTFASHPFAMSMLNFQISGFSAYRGSRQIGKSTGLGIRQIINSNYLDGFASI